MGIERAISILKEWVEFDRSLREYEKDKEYSELSEYGKFCEKRNLAIEKVLDEIEELRGIIIREGD